MSEYIGLATHLAKPLLVNSRCPIPKLQIGASPFNDLTRLNHSQTIGRLQSLIISFAVNYATDQFVAKFIEDTLSNDSKTVFGDDDYLSIVRELKPESIAMCNFHQLDEDDRQELAELAESIILPLMKVIRRIIHTDITIELRDELTKVEANVRDICIFTDDREDHYQYTKKEMKTVMNYLHYVLRIGMALYWQDHTSCNMYMTHGYIAETDETLLYCSDGNCGINVTTSTRANRAAFLSNNTDVYKSFNVGGFMKSCMSISTSYNRLILDDVRNIEDDEDVDHEHRTFVQLITLPWTMSYIFPDDVPDSYTSSMAGFMLGPVEGGRIGKYEIKSIISQRDMREHKRPTSITSITRLLQTRGDEGVFHPDFGSRIGSQSDVVIEEGMKPKSEPAAEPAKQAETALGDDDIPNYDPRHRSNHTTERSEVVDESIAAILPVAISPDISDAMIIDADNVTDDQEEIVSGSEDEPDASEDEPEPIKDEADDQISDADSRSDQSCYSDEEDSEQIGHSIVDGDATWVYSTDAGFHPGRHMLAIKTRPMNVKGRRECVRNAIGELTYTLRSKTSDVCFITIQRKPDITEWNYRDYKKDMLQDEQNELYEGYSSDEDDDPNDEDRAFISEDDADADQDDIILDVDGADVIDDHDNKMTPEERKLSKRGKAEAAMIRKRAAEDKKQASSTSTAVVVSRLRAHRHLRLDELMAEGMISELDRIYQVSAARGVRYSVAARPGDRLLYGLNPDPLKREMEVNELILFYTDCLIGEEGVRGPMETELRLRLIWDCEIRDQMFYDPFIRFMQASDMNLVTPLAIDATAEQRAQQHNELKETFAKVAGVRAMLSERATISMERMRTVTEIIVVADAAAQKRFRGQLNGGEMSQFLVKSTTLIDTVLAVDLKRTIAWSKSGWHGMDEGELVKLRTLYERYRVLVAMAEADEQRFPVHRDKTLDPTAAEEKFKSDTADAAEKAGWYTSAIQRTLILWRQKVKTEDENTKKLRSRTDELIESSIFRVAKTEESKARRKQRAAEDERNGVVRKPRPRKAAGPRKAAAAAEPLIPQYAPVDDKDVDYSDPRERTTAAGKERQKQGIANDDQLASTGISKFKLLKRFKNTVKKMRKLVVESPSTYASIQRNAAAIYPIDNSSAAPQRGSNIHGFSRK